MTGILAKYEQYLTLTIEPEATPAPVASAQPSEPQPMPEIQEPNVHIASDEFEVIAKRLPLAEALTMKEQLNETMPGHRVAHDSDFPRGVQVFMVIKR